ncbi:DgyrCDS9234 [Dimorphilus gyrociliatus]|uniref:DgyrCDS9234 n=1 Tax=Dimorphilus gyrociliatus TaxID=2664684 RepID=A0A7I8VXQ9_9ANNE|nr:DgyrCDS9234 [Dimorphilus gyrociliatus]
MDLRIIISKPMIYIVFPLEEIVDFILEQTSDGSWVSDLGLSIQVDLFKVLLDGRYAIAAELDMGELQKFKNQIIEIVKRFRELEGGNKLIYVPMNYFKFVLDNLVLVEKKYAVQVTPFDLMKDNKFYIEGEKDQTQKAANYIRTLINQDMKANRTDRVED